MDAVRMADLPTTGTDVLVVGAGPTGLMAGLVLTRRGVPVVVVDQKAGPTSGESRALAVQARTMEIYDRALGLADQVLSGAYPTLRMQIGADSPGGFSIADVQQGETRFPGIQIFEQSANEQLLSRSLAGAGTDVLWRHRLVDLIADADQADAGVIALLDVARRTGPRSGALVRRRRWGTARPCAASWTFRSRALPTTLPSGLQDLRGVRGLPDNSMAARFGEATFAVAFPLGPAGHTRLAALAPRDDIGQQGGSGRGP